MTGQSGAEICDRLLRCRGTVEWWLGLQGECMRQFWEMEHVFGVWVAWVTDSQEYQRLAAAVAHALEAPDPSCSGAHDCPEKAGPNTISGAAALV